MKELLPFLTVLASVFLMTDADPMLQELARTKRPELPHVAAGIVKNNPSARPTVLRWIASHRPASLAVVERTLAENRPPTTPGNDHGRRPTVPPGQRYGTP